MFLFRGLRTRLDAAVAAARERRGSERAALRARLRGDDDAPAAPAETRADDAVRSDAVRSDAVRSEDAAQGEPDGGRG
jgi:hypothetical protein